MNDRKEIVRRVQRHFGMVAGGNAIMALLGVLALSLNARALGAAGLGVFAMVTGLATILSRTCSFQTWLPLVSLGTRAMHCENPRELNEITLVALVFDALAAGAATVGAITIVLVAGERLGIPPEYVGAATVYMLALLSGITDAPTGMLRLLDRFAILTLLQVTASAVTCTVAISLYMHEASLTGYLLAFACVTIVNNLVLLGCALHIGARAGIELRADMLGAAWRSVSREFWTFSWSMSASGTIYTLRERAPVLLIGALLGPRAAGLYHVADRLSGTLLSAASAINHALYPEVARLAAAMRMTELRWFVFRTGAICFASGGIVVVGMVVFGPFLLTGIGGSEYTEAYGTLTLLAGAYWIALTGVALRAAVILSMGPARLLVANGIALVGFALTLAFGVTSFGIAGAAAAQVVFEALAVLVVLSQYTKSLREQVGHLDGSRRIASDAAKEGSLP